MEERKFIQIKKQEYGIKEYIKKDLGKGKISRLDIEYTPVGEKIIISTSKPGLVIGRRGEKIKELTYILKSRFKLENPHIEILEIENPLFDSQLVADEIAMALERMGNLRFKVIAYRKLREIMDAGALGCELRLSGKLPSERARTWRFAEGYLKKAGESRKEVDRAEATALTKTGIIGIKVAIMNPKAKIYDQIEINAEILRQINSPIDLKEGSKEEVKKTKEKIKKSKKPVKAKKVKKEIVKKPVETNVIEESPKLPPEEQGTAMKIEEEIEEGVPQEQIDKDIEIKKSKDKEIKNKEGEK